MQFMHLSKVTLHKSYPSGRLSLPSISPHPQKNHIFYQKINNLLRKYKNKWKSISNQSFSVLDNLKKSFNG